MALAQVKLDDKYNLDEGRVLLTGAQALVRLPLVQRRRDLAAGLNTAGFISGYRGSPLGGYDQQLWAARKHLQDHHIVFKAGVNEDLAATSVWGTQQSGFFGDAKYDGVFSIWYGKGPGVDRTGDALKHANLFGTHPQGGVIALAGDDHIAKSSTTAHQSEFAFVDAMVPILNPSGVQEFLDFGLYGFAMSRYAGLWAGFICVTDTVDSTATVDIDPDRVQIRLPTDFEMPEGGPNIRWPDVWVEQEPRLHHVKLPAAVAFVRANRLDRVTVGGPGRRIGIVTTGKSYLDTRQALSALGIDDSTARELGLSVYKVALSWPIEPEGMRAFCEGLEEVIVVEEKRGLIEPQIKELLFSTPADRRPRVVGKTDEDGRELLRTHGELQPEEVAEAILSRLGRMADISRFESRLAAIRDVTRQSGGNQPSLVRTPSFCSGCPHNSGTRLPDGSRAFSGIGCHFMAQWVDPDKTATYTHMGAEGATWAGLHHFVETPHIFQNIGDGTYYHSGILAVRAAVASGANMTYKVLYNDAVAMTGGQPVDGPLSPAMVTQQLAAEGVKPVYLVTDTPEAYEKARDLAPGTVVKHRSELNQVQIELREIEGVSGLVYVQTCAAEKRRRRKRGAFPNPPKRMFINPAVCEGCGDCGVKSNCVSVIPVETEFGRKRMIDQSACNKDYSCLNGFCPSFVTVYDAEPRKGKPAGQAPGPLEVLPEPVIPATDEPYSIMIDGIGGTGVITVGALLAMAAHLEGKAATVMDMTGLAQKGGAVWSHLRIADNPEDLHSVRIGLGGARALIGCDLVTSSQVDTLSRLGRGTSRAVINTYRTYTNEFARNPDMSFPEDELRTRIEAALGGDAVEMIDATRLATALLGDAIGSNLFMAGFAYQRGLVPVGAEAIERAIELNGVAVEMNKTAFDWGRRAAHDLAFVERIAYPADARQERPVLESLDDMVARRSDFLTGYQNAAYAARYTALVNRVREAEGVEGGGPLSHAVARYYFKLLAYKDEYEVARLHASGDFRKQIERQFEGGYRLEFNLAPPLFARKDPVTGEPRKMRFGSWMLHVFRLLAAMRGLRGTAFDPFGRTEERRRERALIAQYEADAEEILSRFSPETSAAAVALASVPEHIRGYGHVKLRHLEAAEKQRDTHLEALRNPGKHTVAAAE